MKQLDLEVIRQAVANFNKTYIDKYLATSDEPECVNEPSSHIPLLDKNNDPVYGEEFFDLMVVNLLLRECDPEKYPINSNVAELITRLGYEGLRHCDILSCDQERMLFCNQIAFNEIPKRGDVWSYLLWVDRYKFNVLTNWFYYTLLLWVMLSEKHHHQYGYRSRILVGISTKYSLTKVSDYNAERKHDVFNIRPQMMRLINTCCKHEFTKWTDMLPYILSSLREFSIITLSSMISRSCAFDIFRPLGMVTKIRSEKFHQKVVDKFYKNHYNN